MTSFPFTFYLRTSYFYDQSCAAYYSISETNAKLSGLIENKLNNVTFSYVKTQNVKARWTVESQDLLTNLQYTTCRGQQSCPNTPKVIEISFSIIVTKKLL